MGVPKRTRTVAALCLAAVLGGCSSSEAAEIPSSSKSPPATVGSDDTYPEPIDGSTLLSIGEWRLGQDQPDQFLVGPRLQLFEDGLAYLSVYSKFAPTRLELVTARLSPGAVRELLSRFESLTPPRVTEAPAIDLLPVPVSALGRTILVYEGSPSSPEGAEVAAFIEAAFAGVRSSGTPWSPHLWVQRPVGSAECEVTGAPVERFPYAAPVPDPLALPTGTFDCDALQSSLVSRR